MFFSEKKQVNLALAKNRWPDASDVASPSVSYIVSWIAPRGPVQQDAEVARWS